MSPLRHALLEDVSVPEEATLGEAARLLAAAPVAALAVLRADGSVLGVVTESDLIGALVPPYLRELRHTAFTEDDLDALARRARQVSAQPVRAHVSKAELVEADTSMTHAAERLLHAGCPALVVVERGRFVGMLSRSELARLLLRPTSE